MAKYYGGQVVECIKEELPDFPLGARFVIRGEEEYDGELVLRVEEYPVGCLYHSIDRFEPVNFYPYEPVNFYPEVPVPSDEPDVVFFPPHYTVGGIDTLDYMRAKMSTEQFEGFLCGNAIKYLSRYSHKGNPIQDLEKAHNYLGMLIEHLKK